MPEKISRVQRGHHPAQVKVWWAVLLHYCISMVLHRSISARKSLWNVSLKACSEASWQNIVRRNKMGLPTGHDARSQGINNARMV